MAAPVRIRLRFWPPGNALRPLLPTDQVVQVYADITDEAGLPVAAEGVTFFFKRPDGTVLTVGGMDVVSPEIGVFYAEMLADQLGDWSVEATCIWPRHAASPPGAGFRVRAADARMPAADAPLWVDQDGNALTAPGGAIVNTLRVTSTPEASSPAGGKLILIQDDQARHATWEMLEEGAKAAGAATGTEAGGIAGTEAGRTTGTEAGAAAGLAAVQPVLADTEAARDAAQVARTGAEEAQTATEAARAAAETARGDAQAAALNAADAAANAAVRLPTLAALQAVTTAAEGTIGEVYEDGANNGSYRRQSGAWALVSTSTLPSLDGRLTPLEGALQPGYQGADLALAITDGLGNTALELSGDGRTLRWAGGTLTLMGDGVLRLTRRDGTASLDLTPDGSALAGGLSITPVAGTDYAYAITDENGFSPFHVKADGTVVVNGLTVATDDAGGVLLKGPDGNVVLRGAAGGAISLPGSLAVAGVASLADTEISAGTPSALQGGAIVWGLSDAQGNLALALLADGTLVTGAISGASFSGSLPPVTALGDAAISIDLRTDIAFGLVDDDGFLGFAVKSDGTLLSPEIGKPVATGYSAAEIAERNARALALSADLRLQVDTTTQRLIFDYNHIILYGQSLSTGQEGHPAKSKISRIPGNLMLGQSVHAQGQGWTSTAWAPIGDSVLRPMVATVRDGGSGLLDDAAVASLAAGAANLGETVIEGTLNMLRRSFLDARGLPASSTAHAFVATSCGISGRTIEQLSKGASPELFNRIRDAASRVKAAASLAGGTYGIPAVLFLQGEYNYTAAHGGDPTKEGYKAKLIQLVADIRADVQQDIAGQLRPFAVFTYQTGAGYTDDANNLAIGQAQLECALEQPNWYMAAPVYPVTDKGGHLDANGYRWLGQQFGKVMHRVLVRGERWRPLSPLQATWRGREVLVDFHVPCPPLVFDKAYVASTATDYAAKGFAVLDASGGVPIQAAEIIGDALVRLTVGRDMAGPITVRYAGQATFSGNGCLRDSDATDAFDSYEYTEGSGDYAAANIAALVGKPYPLANWCVAFNAAAAPG